MKKFLLIILSLAIFTQPAFAFYADVPEDHPQYSEIKALYDQSLLPEYKDNLFNPDRDLKLPDLYELLLSYTQTPLSEELNLPYTDISNDSPFAAYIQTALDLGLLNANALNPVLKSEITLTKNKTLQTLFDALGIGTTYFFDKETFPFIDVATNSDRGKLAAKAAELGIFESETPTYFKSSKRVTRAETTAYLYNIQNYLPGASTIKIEFAPESDSQSKIQDKINDEELEIIVDVWNKLQNEYLYKDELNSQEMAYNAIKGLLTGITDKYTVYQDPTQAAQFITSISSEYEGVGMSVELIDGNVTVISPFIGSPAEEAGIEPNDIIIEVDGENMEGQTVDYVVSKIKGEAGTEVKLKILRGDEKLDFNVKRDFILNTSVNYEVMEKNGKNIAYIQLLFFGDTSYKEFLTASNDIVARDDIDGIIIDVRNNPGGYLNTAVAIADLFLDEIKIIAVLEFVDGEKENYHATEITTLKDYETVVIVNDGSASASEILAGALRDQDVATIVGETTFGKGTAQDVITYVDGSLFKYTVAKWLTPKGTDINGEGITPDVEIVDNENTQKDEQLEKALSLF